MSGAISANVLKEELETLGIESTYHNMRRIRRAMEINLHLQSTSTYSERKYKAESQSKANKKYTVTSDGTGVHCHCADSKKSEVCKHALAVMRWEAGFEVKNCVVESTTVKTNYPVKSYTVAIPLTEEWGVRVATVRATSENEALGIANESPDMGIIISGEEEEYNHCPEEKPVVMTTQEFQRKFPAHKPEESSDQNEGYDAEFMYGNNRLGHKGAY